MKQFACIHHALSNGGLATSPNTKPRSSGPTSANTECWPSAKDRIQARERAREVTPTARARAKEVLQAPTAREVEKQVLEVTSTSPPKDPRCLHNRPWDTLEAPELDILLNNIHLLSIILLRLAMARIMLGMVASSIRARIPAITRAEEAITAAGRTNSSSREWIYRVDNTRYDLDISGVLLHRDSRSVHPVVVGMPAHESGPPRKQHTQRDAVVKIATWNVANMSTTETALAYMSSVLNRHSIDFLALTETHLEDDLLVGRLRSMNWNVEVRERDNSSTGGVAIVIHKARVGLRTCTDR